MNKTAIINGRIILPDGVIAEDKVLIYSDGKIEEIIPSGEFEAEKVSETIDAGGRYVSPGFIDMHIHGGGGHDFMDGTVEAFLGVAKSSIFSALIPVAAAIIAWMIGHEHMNSRQWIGIAISTFGVILSQYTKTKKV